MVYIKNEQNELNLDNINSKNDEQKTDNLHLNDKDSEIFKEEALFIYNAINEGGIDVSPKEKKEILQEIDLILNYFNSSQSNEKFTSSEGISENAGEKINSDSNIDQNIKMNVNLNLEKKVNSFEEDSDSIIDCFPNDFLLNAGIDNQKSNDSFDKNQHSENFEDSEGFGCVESFDDVVDVFNDLSVDDALNELIDDYSNEVVIKVENISMEFKVSKDKIDTLKEFVIRTIKRNKSDSKIVTALKNVSFEISKGDRVGIIGFNGAGKSTLLKVLAGVYDATEGIIETNGKIAPLLELGAGFDNNYTGKDNIFLNGAFLGYSEDFLKEKYEEILEFSELGEAINYHVKTYSSGMRAKLGFSIATIVEPDILILDEILSVGDIKFRKKSADKIRSLINSGITVLLVSHSVSQIRDMQFS